MYIGIDPSYAKCTAIAWSKDGKKIDFATVHVEKKELKKETRNLQTFALKVFNYILSLEPEDSEETIIGIESQFFGRNAAMVMALIELRCLIQGMLLLKFPKIKVISISPRIWQGKVLQIGRLKSEEIKKISIKKASLITKLNPSEDESDAINILKYIIDNKKDLKNE